jgi:catechol 2,3-dioxygenase-like lactoylglutathione lyase family enzyme
MKRFHVHISVRDLNSSIDFYTKLFGHTPTKEKPDYAKWMLDDPRINFAISSRGHSVGVNHFGFQADSSEELQGLRQLAEKASEGQLLDQGAAACCYSKSEKHWTTDPQGLAWENFYTMNDAEVFGEDSQSESGACCIPLANKKTSSCCN